MFNSKRLLCLTLCFFTHCMFIYGEEGDPFDALGICKMQRDSMSWQNSVSMKVNTTKALKSDERSFNNKTIITMRRDHNRMEWLGKRLRFDSEGNVMPDASTAIQTIFDNKQKMTVIGLADGSIISAYIKKRFGNEEKEQNIDALEFGGFLDGNLYGANHENLNDLLVRSPDLHMLNDPEYVEGVACYVLEGNTEYGKITAWIAPSKSFNALKYTIEKTKKDLFNDKSLEELKIKTWVVSVDSVECQKVGDVYVPVSGQLTRTIEMKDGKVTTLNVQSERSDIMLYPDFDALGAFEINLPDGTKIDIQEIPGIRFEWRDGKVVVAVDEDAILRLEETIDGFNKQNDFEEPKHNIISDLPEKSKITKGVGKIDFEQEKSASSPVLISILGLSVIVLGLALFHGFRKGRGRKE